MRTFAIHSYKGGTGKTTLAANLAAIMAKKGHDVAILDTDFQAPSLHTLFGIAARSAYINDFLSEKVKHTEILTDIGSSFDLSGQLLVGFSDPNVEAIREQLAKDRKWHMQAISQLLVLKQKLEKEGFDYFILDSAPGVHYSSVNTIVVSDFTIIVAKIDNFDFDGTAHLLDELYGPLNKNTMLLFNKVVPNLLESSSSSGMIDMVKEMFENKTQLLGFLPCYCNVPLGMGSEVLALTQPDLPFIKQLSEIEQKIENAEFPGE
ncbi:MAG: AAA family ATPase [Candidatus Lokiarchaeota archaeon]|nr:AAA family ATPase [Candidatus Lokiarchaeota archaeon]